MEKCNFSFYFYLNCLSYSRIYSIVIILKQQCRWWGQEVFFLSLSEMSFSYSCRSWGVSKVMPSLEPSSLLWAFGGLQRVFWNMSTKSKLGPVTWVPKRYYVEQRFGKELSQSWWLLLVSWLCSVFSFWEFMSEEKCQHKIRIY